MNLSDLQSEFARQAADVPNPDHVIEQIHRDLAVTRRRRKRRYVTALAVVAVVLAAVSGTLIAANLHSQGTSSSDASRPTGTDSRPVNKPATTSAAKPTAQLITTAQVASPVTATAIPAGFTHMSWLDGPGLLAQFWFPPPIAALISDDGAGEWGVREPTESTSGYVVDNSKNSPLTGPDGKPTVATSTTVTVGGHSATLLIAAAGTRDEHWLPAQRRIQWQLPDGQWIHVWADINGLAQPNSDFAAGIVSRTTTLTRSVIVGLGLPGLSGLTEVSSFNDPVVSNFTTNTTTLCPPGKSPFISLDASTPTSQSESPNISACLVASIKSQPDASLKAATGTAIAVTGRTAHVNVATGQAWIELNRNVASVQLPASPRLLSATELAQIVAAVADGFTR